MVIAEPILESAAQSLDKNCLGNQLAIETLKKNNVQYYVFTGLPCYKDGEFLVDGTAYDISASKIDLVLADGSIDAEKYLNFNAEADVDPMAALLANLNF